MSKWFECSLIKGGKLGKITAFKIRVQADNEQQAEDLAKREIYKSQSMTKEYLKDENILQTKELDEPF